MRTGKQLQSFRRNSVTSSSETSISKKNILGLYRHKHHPCSYLLRVQHGLEQLCTDRPRYAFLYREEGFEFTMLKKKSVSSNPWRTLCELAANLSVNVYAEDAFFSVYISNGIVFRFGRTGPSKQHEHIKARAHTHTMAPKQGKFKLKLIIATMQIKRITQYVITNGTSHRVAKEFAKNDDQIRPDISYPFWVTFACTSAICRTHFHTRVFNP